MDQAGNRTVNPGQVHGKPTSCRAAPSHAERKAEPGWEPEGRCLPPHQPARHSSTPRASVVASLQMRKPRPKKPQGAPRTTAGLVGVGAETAHALCRAPLPEPGSTSHLRALQAISAASMPATPPDLASPHLWSNSCAVEHTQALGPERKQAGLIGNHASPCPPAASVLALTLSCHLQNPMSGVSWEAP